MEISFWFNNSPLQGVVNKLNELIPASGSVAEPKKNKALEKFRKASNCYHDLYNNGLGNRRSEFRNVFGIASTKYQTYSRRGKSHTDELFELLEAKMEVIVKAAAVEQGIM